MDTQRNGTIILTGASGGLSIGFIQNLIASPIGAEQYAIYTTRSIKECDSLKRVLEKAPRAHQHEILELDLSSLENVRAFAEKIKRLIATGDLPPIRALYLNATVWQATGQRYSRDGFEMNFAVNYLANFLLVLLLLGAMDKQRGRIILTSSTAHDPYFYQNTSFIVEESHKTVFRDTEILAHPTPDKKGDESMSGVRRYGMSKMLCLMFM